MRSPAEEGFEEVGLHGVDAISRRSSEVASHRATSPELKISGLSNGIMMRDLEDPLRTVSLDEKVDQALRKDDAEVKLDSKIHAPGGFPEDNNFHSLPSTPWEAN